MWKNAPTRAREVFERNMRREAPKAPSPVSSITNTLKSKVPWIGAGIAAAIAGIATFITNVESLQSRYSAYSAEQAYFAGLKHPYPALLDPGVIAGWSSGRIHLAMFQIDGYRGKLKSSPPWVKLCLTSDDIFGKETAKTQFNDRIEQTESFIDQQNKLNLQHRLDQIDNGQIEDAETLTINDPFSKLLARSKSQLLSRYKESEISQLDKAELYLLRNAIYGRHGRSFYTAKLSKYAARMGWTHLQPRYKPSLLSPVELCNAFFLQQLHPNQELGALGRGVLIKASTSDTANFVRPAICACLAQPQFHIECQRNSRGSNGLDFGETVDFILEMEQGPQNKVEWTFLKESDVADADIDIFKNHEEKFYSAALNFNVAVESAFQAANLHFVEIGDAKHGPYWGVRLILSPDTLLALAGNPVFAHKLSENICGTVHRSLETVGPFIPRMVSLIPLQPYPDNPLFKIWEKAITFNDERIKLTKDYVKKHYGVSLLEVQFVPSMLAVHASGTNDFQTYFEKVRLPALPPKDNADSNEDRELNASTHYVIDRDGKIYSLVKQFQIARHSIGLDRHAIGITAIGSSEQPLTDDQVTATATLVRYLKEKFPSIEWVVGDAEISAFQRTQLWEETLPFKTDKKEDPGPEFMGKLRADLTNLQLKQLP
ncbi:MAG: N-acetylmuramoyl-L-alanine amidase [Bradyrhizobium sp.]|jgi:hypothetical protein|nr:N-acetylmuramoyl-L-alanine amidase [Bradyrhizobium sp.]